MSKFECWVVTILQKIGYCLFFILYKIFVRIEIIGKENLINLEGPVILAPNHTSELDTPAIPLVLPFFSPLFPICFAMVPIKKYKTFGWRSYFYGSGFLTLLGGYSVFSGYKDYAVSLKDHINLLKQGYTLCIFPEGKRTQDGLFNPAHGGLGYLVYVSEATVIPIAINTFFNISWLDFLKKSRKVRIKIGKPIRANELIPTELKNPEADDFRHISQIVLNRSKEIMN